VNYSDVTFLESLIPVKKATNTFQVSNEYALLKRLEVIVKRNVLSMITLYYSFAHLMCVVAQGFFYTNLVSQ
jgi:hypothetical protein